MRTDGVAPRRGVGGSTRSRIAWLLSSAAALQACLCSSLSTAGDVAGGRGLVMPAGVGASGSFAGAHARADRGHAQSCDTAEDSMDEDIKLHLGEMDDLVAQMSQFQERAAVLASELDKRVAENNRLVAALDAALPHGDVEESEAIRRREMLESMGLPAGMEVDSASIAPAPRALADDLVGAVADGLEMGSSPMFSMHPVDTPARLRGGGGGSIAQVVREGAGVDRRWAKPRAVELGVCGAGGVGVRWEDARRLGRLTLRGGGNVLPFGSKYTAEQTKLNKQLCGAVKRGEEKEIKRLVKEGADPSYPDCDMLGFSALHLAVNHRQAKSLETLYSLGANMNIRDGLGWTLMHQAAQNADIDTVERLHKYGTSCLVKNNAGRLPAAVTKAAGNGPAYRDCYKKLLGMQEKAAGAKAEEVQKKVQAATAHEEDDDEDDEEEEEEQKVVTAAKDTKDVKK